MEILQLEHFLAVAEERTFTRAAERVFRTQPAVSQSAKKLEEEMGVPLFARDLNDVTLAQAGKLLADYARRMLGLLDQATRRVCELKDFGTPILPHPSLSIYSGCELLGPELIRDCIGLRGSLAVAAPTTRSTVRSGFGLTTLKRRLRLIYSLEVSMGMLNSI
jgi:Bacterial regulatory helix-turn-helix protein, lysR family